MFANIGEFFVSSSLLESLAVDELPPAKWTDGLTVELLAVDERSPECLGDKPSPAKWLVERVVAEGRWGMRLSMPRARAVEEYSNSSKVKWGVNCIRKRIYDE